MGEIKINRCPFCDNIPEVVPIRNGKYFRLICWTETHKVVVESTTAEEVVKIWNQEPE